MGFDAVFLEYSFRFFLALTAAIFVLLVPRLSLFLLDRYVGLDSFKEWFNHEADGMDKAIYYSVRFFSVNLSVAIVVGLALS